MDISVTNNSIQVLKTGLIKLGLNFSLYQDALDTSGKPHYYNLENRVNLSRTGVQKPRKI